MKKKVAATREDIDDVLRVLSDMMQKIDARFNGVEGPLNRLGQRMSSVEQRLEVMDNGRFAAADQLDRLQDWAEVASERIELKFAR